MRSPRQRNLSLAAALSALALALASCGTTAGSGTSSSSHPTTTARNANSVAVRWMVASGALHLLSQAARQLIENSPNNLIIYAPSQTPANTPAVPVATFRSYASLATTLADGGLSKRFKYVLLDLEVWQFTPANEQADPILYYQEAARLLKNYGLELIAAPGSNIFAQSPSLSGPNYQRMLSSGLFGAVAPFAAIFSIQSQSLEFKPSLFSAYVSQAASALRSANPSIVVFAGLSTNPPAGTASASQLSAAMNSVSTSVHGFWLNIPKPGPSCPNCNPVNAAAANDLLSS